MIQLWTLFWVHIWTKNGISHRRISLLPAHVVQADLRPCSLNMNVNSYLFLFVRPKSGCDYQGSLSQPCLDHFFGPCFRGHDEAGLLAFSMSLFSDVGPLEAIAENKTEQKSAAKRRQRLLKASLKRQATMRVFPQRGAYSWWTWPTIPWNRGICETWPAYSV